MTRRYTGNPLYRIKKVGKAHYLRHQNGARVKTDKVINMIWEAAADSTAGEIQARLEGRTYISSWLLDNVLRMMTEADILRADPAPVDSAPAAPAVIGPLVSVVIVNKDGAEHLSALLPSLARQDYQKIEIVMVDNGSKDESVDMTRKFFPGATIVELKKNIGFAAGNNVGIERAAGDYLFLLNNDTELADDCVSRLVEKAAGREDVAAVVPKMFLWRLPKFLNAIGNAVRNRGWGGDNYIGYLDIGQFDDIEEVYSACFGAVLIGRKALMKVGLLDPKYLFYYEDADWSYRARAMGLKIIVAPQAAVFHKFSASMQTLEPNFKWRLVISNRLRYITKNLSKGAWLNFMRNYFREDARAFLGSVKHRDFPMARTYLNAWARFVVGMPGILSERRWIQKSRKVADADMFKLWPELPPLMDESGNPILDVATVRRIYTHFMVDTPAGDSSPGPVAAGENPDEGADPDEGIELSLDR